MSEILPDNEDGIDIAVRLLLGGDLVVMPTETVYGLAADAMDFEAVAKIFALKGRPPTNPLIVHIASADHVDEIAYNNDRAKALANNFWPGPLTIVLPARPSVATNVTAGGSTVGIRVPNHPVALELLRACRIPLAAPSANRSEQLSPTTVDDVMRGLGRLCPPVLDGGPCSVGIESTVVDLTASTPRVLRPGAISQQQLEDALGVAVAIGAADSTIRSPGQMPRHYAPTTPAILSESPWSEPRAASRHAAVLHFSDKPENAPSANAIKLPTNPFAYAAGLYTALHLLDRAYVELIVIETPPEGDEWIAVRDRLSRATAPRSPLNEFTR
jgi:L-threonylcarbamoyladenylate synthase